MPALKGAKRAKAANVLVTVVTDVTVLIPAVRAISAWDRDWTSLVLRSAVVEWARRGGGGHTLERHACATRAGCDVVARRLFAAGRRAPPIWPPNPSADCPKQVAPAR